MLRGGITRGDAVQVKGRVGERRRRRHLPEDAQVDEVVGHEARPQHQQAERQRGAQGDPEDAGKGQPTVGGGRGSVHNRTTIPGPQSQVPPPPPVLSTILNVGAKQRKRPRCVMRGMEQPRSSTWTPHPHSLRREPVVFGHVMELLLTDLELIHPRAREALAGMGLSSGEPHAVYSSAAWVGAIHVLSGALYSHLSSPSAEFALGRRFMARLLRSRLGEVMNTRARATGPERTLHRLPNQLRMLNNYLGASVHALPGAGRWELSLRPLPEFFLSAGVHVEPPHFTRGAIITSFQAAGVFDLQMDLMRHDVSLGTSTFHLTF
ncbi:DUF2378 family protein [Archangium violaceum]|nr:DUF2378 family protein [Archangium violaceum]